ncbi:hypothetical protein [Streptomyces sp. NBC_00503]|uniref:hypothetical protein n=1 Tax=Streptomyces sp. NBC_00503 TaxID=2903659 RepID=UPI002E81C26C|nr:hypothetical protein [Streptomyces sp. NBC_00503]WUD84170.1 hypothetical protein OG490_28460 [Streptomyces sp. NBC_00503]
MNMRRGFVAAAVAGAAGITLGLMPLGSAFAATSTSPSGLPQTYQCSDWRGDGWWRNCCDPSRGSDRPSWCWDNSNWNNDSWNNNWDNSNWSNDHWNDGRHDGDWNNHDHDGGWNNDSWNNDGGWNGNGGHGHDGGWNG